MAKKDPLEPRMAPPKWADKFLEWYCSSELLAEIQGDLHEAFFIRLRKYNHRKASLLFIKEVLLFCRPSSFGTISYTKDLVHILSLFMHDIKITFRSLAKYKMSASISVFGLVLGISAFLFILGYGLFELSYDRFHDKGDQIFRIRNDHFSGGLRTANRAITYRGAGPSMKDELPDVLDFTRMNGLFGRNLIISATNKVGDPISFVEEEVYYVDDNFFSIFSFPLIHGDSSRALNEPNSIVITEEIASKYFGSEDPLGQVMTVDGSASFTVTGVLKDIPENSHMKFDLLFPIKSLPEYQNDQAKLWSGAGGDVAYTYILLASETDHETVERKFPDFLSKHQNPHIGEAGITDLFILQPLRDIHLHSDLEFEMRVNGHAGLVRFLMISGFLVLIIAWINYINLSTVWASKRAREIGVRKVVGATRGRLTKQFLTEALVLNVLAMILSALVMMFLFPVFKTLTQLEFESVYFEDWGFLLFPLLFLVFGALASGMYPAFIMSSFKPIEALRGKESQKFRGVSLVTGITVFQYAVSIILLTGTLTVFNQVDFMKRQDLGIEVDQTIVINAPKIAPENYSTALRSFEGEVLQHPAYLEMTASSEIPGKSFSATSMMALSQTSLDQHHRYASAWVDYNYLTLFKLDILAGRNFSEDFSTDDNAIIVNEEFVRSLGVQKPEDAIGKLISSNRGGMKKIIGVVNNYHQVSLKSAIEPAVFFLNSERNRKFVSFRIVTKNFPDAISVLQGEYEAMFPGNPFEYFFLDDYFDQQYKADKSFGRVFVLFSILAIFITCLGLFNLSFITSLNRVKEIAIRKVLGASIASILILISRDFIKLIVMGSLVGIPIVWIVLQEWLANYAFRIDLSYGLLLTPAMLMLIVAGITISYHIIGAARSNPVVSLQHN